MARVEGKAIALENLQGIRDSRKFNRMMSWWNFRELAMFIEYKAALAGMPLVYVDPKHGASIPGVSTGYRRLLLGSLALPGTDFHRLATISLRRRVPRPLWAYSAFDIVATPFPENAGESRTLSHHDDQIRSDQHHVIYGFSTK